MIQLPIHRRLGPHAPVGDRFLHRFRGPGQEAPVRRVDLVKPHVVAQPARRVALGIERDRDELHPVLALRHPCERVLDLRQAMGGCWAGPAARREDEAHEQHLAAVLLERDRPGFGVRQSELRRGPDDGEPAGGRLRITRE